jgi:hypothetical protein
MKEQKTDKCRRTVVWGGVVREIEVEHHSYAWSGKMPCTGVYRCVFCGQVEGKKG